MPSVKINVMEKDILEGDASAGNSPTARAIKRKTKRQDVHVFEEGGFGIVRIGKRKYPLSHEALAQDRKYSKLGAEKCKPFSFVLNNEEIK